MFTKRYISHYKALVSLGVPIVIGQVGNIILGFADTLMIGHHSMLELAAAGFINTIFMLVVIFAMGFSYGLTPVVGSMSGRGEHGEIGGVVRSSISANTVLAAILLAAVIIFYLNLHRMGQPEELLPYMRPYLLVNIVSLPFVCWLNTFKQFYDAIGHTKVPMFVFLGGNVANILGNYVLIYGVFGLPELGLLGAGVSTLLSRVLMFAAFAVLFFTSTRYRVYRDGFLSARPSPSSFRRLNALGWPIALQMGMETAAFSLVAVFVGWLGSTALAAHQVMLTVSQLFYMVYYGMAAAVAVRVSYFRGQGDRRAVGDTATAGFHIIMLLAAVFSVPIFLLRHHIGSWFTDDADVCRLVSVVIIPLIVYQFGDGLQCTFANAMRGIACVKPMMYIAFVAYFVISLPLSWLLGLHLGYGLAGIWAAFPVCLTCAGVMYWAKFRKEKDL